MHLLEQVFVGNATVCEQSERPVSGEQRLECTAKSVKLTRALG